MYAFSREALETIIRSIYKYWLSELWERRISRINALSRLRFFYHGSHVKRAAGSCPYIPIALREGNPCVSSIEVDEILMVRGLSLRAVSFHGRVFRGFPGFSKGSEISSLVKH